MFNSQTAILPIIVATKLTKIAHCGIFMGFVCTFSSKQKKCTAIPKCKIQET